MKIQNYTFDSIGFVLYFHVLIMLMCHLQYLNFCYNLKMMYRIILKYYKYISDSLHLLPILSTQCIYSVSHLFSKDSMLRIFIVFSTYTVYTLAIYFRRMSVFFDFGFVLFFWSFTCCPNRNYWYLLPFYFCKFPSNIFDTPKNKLGFIYFLRDRKRLNSCLNLTPTQSQP